MPDRQPHRAEFKCPRCSAVYEMTRLRRGKADDRMVECSYCGDVMAEWHGQIRHFRRKRRPQDPRQWARTILDAASRRVGRRAAPGGKRRAT